ncbi:MAG: hypothetical protein AAF741_14665 [Bacteroidota bacterium]
MRSTYLVLHITNEAVRFNETDELNWAQTNFPKSAATFRTHEPIYWLVEMLRYEAKTGMLEVEVIEYEADEEDLIAYYQQKMKRPVNGLAFSPLIKDELRAQLSYFDPSALAEILESEPEEPLESDAFFALPQVEDQSPKPEERQLSFTVPFDELEIKLGEVVGQTTIDPFPDLLSFTIQNDYLIPEFEHIKGYFAKLLKRKSIVVQAKLFIDGEEVELRNCRSPQIAAINQDMLQLARRRRLREILKPSYEPEVDKSLFTPDDLFGNVSSEDLGSKLTADGADAILQEIFAIRKVRNRKQLAWLAGHLHDEREPIRYTLRPQFGFLFFSEGEAYNHFIWELLNSHATYIWSFDRDESTPARHYKLVEREVAKIGQYGRMLYRRTDLDSFLFSTIRHPGANSKLVDGFPKWRNKLLEIMV